MKQATLRISALAVSLIAAGTSTQSQAQAQAQAQAQTQAQTQSQPRTPTSFTPRRVYLANDDHTDFMWSADANTYQKVFVDQLDFHMKLADETRDQPEPYRARFNTDGNYWLWTYERLKTPAEFERLIARVKDGTINSPLNTLVSTYGGQPVEAVLRGMYYAGRLERRHGLRFRIATATENQTLPLGLASLFAGAGASYTFRGVCGCASHISNKVLFDRPSDVYWYTGHDGQRQLMKWYSLGPHNIGTYWEAGEPEQALAWFENDPGFARRHVDPKTKKPYEVIGLFGFGGDDLARKTGVEPPPGIPAVPGLQKVISSPRIEHFSTLARRLTNSMRQVRVSNEVDYFVDMEKTHGANLPARAVTHGNEWDLYSASMSETSARVKRAVEKLRSAELLSTLVSLRYPAFMNNHATARDEAFTDLGLYWEHNWTADGPVTRGQRAAWQDKLASNIEYYVNSIYSEGIVRLGGMIPRPAKTANRFFVLNPLGWTRSEFADFPLKGPHDIHVRDISSGKDVPHQIVKLQGRTHVRIHAPDVPSAGYKVFEILAGQGTAASNPAAEVGPEDAQGRRVVENAAVRLVLARDGALLSFIDKRRGGAELAATIDGLAMNDFAAHSEAGEPLQVENVGPVSVSLRARSDAGLPHSTVVTVYRDSDRVDIRNEIHSNFGNVRHWSFGFNLKAPKVYSEEVGGINLNKLQSEGGDYATSHARYDYITLNHFADISAGDGHGGHGMTLSNADLAFAKLGRSTVNKLDSQTPQIHVLAGGQVDGPWLGIQDQNGASQFLQRFALRAHGGYDPVAAMRFALEHQNPLQAGAVISDGQKLFPEASYSLLQASDPRVLLWALKPAEEGIDHGIVARLWNVSDSPATSQLRLTPGVAAAQRSSHVETDLEAVELAADGSVPTQYAKQQLQTYRIRLKP